MAVPAQVAGERLEQIAERNGNVLRPCDVVDDSRPEQAPLHPCFTWDDETAAEKYREDEARRIIHTVYVVRPPDDEEQEPRPQLAYVHVSLPNERQSYMGVARVMGDQELREQALTEAWTQLRAWRQRYAHLEELARIFGAVDGDGGDDGPPKPPPKPKRPKKPRK